MLLSDLHCILPSTLKVHLLGSSNETFTEVMNVVEFSVLVQTVGQPMKVKMTRLGITMQSGKQLSVGEVRLLQMTLYALRICEVRHVVQNMKEVNDELLPVRICPILALLSRRGEFKANGRSCNLTISELRLVAVEVDLHLVPHGERSSTFVKEIGVDDVRTLILRDVVGELSTIRTSFTLRYHVAE